MRNLTTASLTLLLGCLAAEPAAGQIRFDPASRDYFVTITGDDGRPVEMRVVPPNKVSATVTESVTREAELFRYAYAVTVDSGSAQSLRYFRFSCPPGARFEAFAATRVSAGGARPESGFRARRSNELVCTFESIVPPGATLTASLRSDLLPAIGPVRLIGRTPGVRWPTEEPVEDEAVRRSVDSLSGVTGGWLEMTTIVPVRAPGAMSGAAGLAQVRADLGHVCALGWISHAGTCHSLQVKLDQGNIDAFLHELDAQRNKKVNDQAYWLLRTNAEWVRDHP